MISMIRNSYAQTTVTITRDANGDSAVNIFDLATTRRTFWRPVVSTVTEQRPMSGGFIEWPHNWKVISFQGQKGIRP